MLGRVVFHPSGFVEVPTGEGLLILTEAEYSQAQRRGQSVIDNKNLMTKGKAEMLKKHPERRSTVKDELQTKPKV